MKKDRRAFLFDVHKMRNEGKKYEIMDLNFSYG
jgi:hypothetical protein